MNQNRKTFIAFDQYQRYETIARIIDFYRESSGKDVFRILEVGANEHKDMKLFLPDDSILFTDIVLTDSMQDDPEFMAADGTALPFDNGSFDFVFAADVLEHIPAKDRQKFLSESCRVARRCVILSFPFQSPDVVDAENRVNSYYKAISGQDFIWLHEHQANGLPKLQDIDNDLDQQGCHYFSFFHGDIRTWEKMWYCHFDTVFAPETLEYRRNIDHYYNCNLYSGDISDSCYRAFYVMPHERFDELNEYVSTMWNSAAQEPAEFLTTLLQAHGHVHPLFMQNRLQEELTKKEVHIQNLTAMHQRAEEQSGRRAERLEQCLQQQEADRQLLTEQAERIQQYQARQETDARAIAEQAARLERYLQQQEADRQRLTEQAERLQKYQSQREIDAQAITEQTEQIKQYCLRQESDQQALAAAEKHCDEVEKALTHYKEHYLAAINQREELKRQLAQAQDAYNVISNAFFWKITKPFRFTLDGVKSLLKKNYYTHLMGKGLKCWKENGFKYTWQKVKNRRNRGNEWKRNLQAQILTEAELQEQREAIFEKKIKFSILTPLYNTPDQFLREMIESVQAQTYSNWELCLADGSDAEHIEVSKIVQFYSRRDKRIKYQKLKENRGISENTNVCIDMATGDYIALLDHDDILSPNALYEVMREIEKSGADFIYSDEATFSGSIDNIITPHYKPGYSPDTLRVVNYICHLSVMSREVLEKTGRLCSKYDGSQDHDFVLRVTDNAKIVKRIPKFLYFWRFHPGSTSSDISTKPYAIEAAHNLLRADVRNRGMAATVESLPICPTMYRIRYEIKENYKVSILIPTKDGLDYISGCVDSILENTTYMNYEIIIVDTGSSVPEVFDYYETLKKYPNVKILTYDKPFNYSDVNNFGVEYAVGDQIVLLNNDTKVITPDWIQEMLMYAQREDVGAVGAKLYYGDDTIQHAGVGIGIFGLAGHYFNGFPRNDMGYMGRLYWVQNLSAVTGACVMIPRKVWDEVRGLDNWFDIAFSDIDLCMRIRRAGYLVVWTPFAELYHFESKTLGYMTTPEKQERFQADVARFKQRFAKELDEGDPYYNPNLTLERTDYTLK